VWVGNPRNEAMQNVSGVTGAAPIWHNIVERTFAEHPDFKNIAPHDLPVPQGLVQAEVCNESGLIPGELCPPDRRHSEIFPDNQAPDKFDDVWIKVKVDTTNDLLANDNCPPEIVEERFFAKLHEDLVLPYERIVNWGKARGYNPPPTESSPCTNNQPGQETPDPVQVRINRPDNGAQVSGIVNVNGIAFVPEFGSYVVEVGRGGGQWVPVGGGNQPVNPRGRLAEFDANAFGEGELDIRLTVFNVWGQPFEDKVRVFVVPGAPPTEPPTATPEAPTPEPTRARRTRTPQPTDVPTEVPTVEPTLEPTQQPTLEPTAAPTQQPTPQPTEEPTAAPTAAPTDEPTAVPTDEPTAAPTGEPTAASPAATGSP
jgi:hypothetical protein